MNLSDRLRALADGLPSDGSAVTLHRADIMAMLEDAEEPASASKDLAVVEVAAEVGRAPSTVRGWLIAGELRGYKRKRS